MPDSVHYFIGTDEILQLERDMFEYRRWRTGWDGGLGHNYRHWVETYTQEGTLWYTESRCNGFIRTENRAQRK